MLRRRSWAWHKTGHPINRAQGTASWYSCDRLTGGKLYELSQRDALAAQLLLNLRVGEYRQGRRGGCTQDDCHDFQKAVLGLGHRGASGSTPFGLTYAFASASAP